MRIVSNRWPTVADGRRYLFLPTTSDRGGPSRARLDTYKERVRLEPGEATPAVFERLRRRLFDYEIFSPSVVGYRLLPASPITDGCTVVQRIGVGVVFLESATRVVDMWDTADPDGSRGAGFAYVALQGHPERGVATFEVRQEGDAVFVVLTARSVPGTMLTKIASPATRLVQRTITKQAMRRLTTGR